MKNRPANIFCLIALLALTNDRMLRAQTNTNGVGESTINAAVEVSVPAATNANLAVPPKPRPPTRIEADRAEFDTAKREATYFGHVRVDDPDMKLRCEWLAADLPQAVRRVNHIVAETNVVIDSTDSKGQTTHVTSDKAVYDFQVKDSVTNETVTLTGNPQPQVENAQGTMAADVIVWDRANNSYRFIGNYHAVGRQIFGGVADTNLPPATTNNLAAPK